MRSPCPGKRRRRRELRRGRQWILTAPASGSARLRWMAAAAGPAPGPRGRAITAGLRVAGAGLLIAAAAIHLDLYLTGYRSIPVIGGLFLLQVIVGFLAGAVVLVTGSRLAAAAGAVFALATLGGYLLSVWAAVRVHGGPHHGRDRRRRGRGGRVRGAGRPDRPSAASRSRPLRALPGPAAAWLDGEAAGAAAAIGGVSAVALVLLGVAAGSAGGPPGAGPPAGPRGRHGPEDHHYQRRNGADQRQGLDPVLVRPRYRRPGRPALGPARSTGRR